jgi:hypothetical protein
MEIDAEGHLLISPREICERLNEPTRLINHFLDREIRMWERNPKNKAFSGAQFSKSIARQKQRGFYTYRYFDLPPIGCVSEHTAQLKALPVEACCGLPRPIDAFIFRDWWSLYSRWEFDLRDLRRALRDGLEPGGDVARRVQEAE